MSTLSDDLKVKDVANAAAIVAEAAMNAPDRELATVSTPYGRADVVLDGAGADVDFHGRDLTVHVRTE